MSHFIVFIVFILYSPDEGLSRDRKLEIKTLNLATPTASSFVSPYTVRIKIKEIHIQRPIVLKSNGLKICMWHIGEEQLILFLLVPFLHQVCHA